MLITSDLALPFHELACSGALACSLSPSKRILLAIEPDTTELSASSTIYIEFPRKRQHHKS